MNTLFLFYSTDKLDVELPTLLHLAAKYGLTELGSSLTDLPDAKLVCCLGNADGRMPEELAQACNHSQLAQLFENYRELVGERF